MIGLRSLAGGRLFARRHGSGPPQVLALHGWGRDSSDFDRVLDGLDGLALDLPGFGSSPPPDSSTGADGYAELIAPVLEEFPSPPVVVGHSFGGRVAVAMAAGRPGSVGGLVLTGVPLVQRPRRPPPAAYRLARAGHRLGILSERRMESLRRRYGSSDYRAAHGTMRGVLVKVVNESYESELGRLSAPVGLVWGEADAEVPVTVAEQARDLLAASGIPVTMVVVPGAGHLLPSESPLALRQAIEPMLVT